MSAAFEIRGFFPIRSIRVASRAFAVKFPPSAIRTMTTPSQAIEVEVIEIDGAAPPEKFETSENSPPRSSWQTEWQGRVRKLDSRWWPLWVLLGTVAVVLLLTVGLVLGIIFVIFRILRGLIRAIFG
jgi:sensor domain CHASE-containing protein